MFWKSAIPAIVVRQSNYLTLLAESAEKPGSENGTLMERHEARNSLGLLPRTTQKLNSCHVQGSQAVWSRLHFVICIFLTIKLLLLLRILALQCEY